MHLQKDKKIQVFFPTPSRICFEYMHPFLGTGDLVVSRNIFECQERMGSIVAKQEALHDLVHWDRRWGGDWGRFGVVGAVVTWYVDSFLPTNPWKRLEG